MSKLVKRVFQYFCFPNRPIKVGNILDFQKGGNLRTPLPTMVTSKDENDVEALMLTSKLNRASLGISPQYPEKIVKVLSLKRFKGVTWEMLAVTLGKFPFAPRSLLFELFSFTTSVCQCYMNMWNIQESNLTTLMDNLIKLKH